MSDVPWSADRRWVRDGMGGVIRLRGLRLSPPLPVLPPIQSCRPSEPKNRQYDMIWYDIRIRNQRPVLFLVLFFVLPRVWAIEFYQVSFVSQSSVLQSSSAAEPMNMSISRPGACPFLPPPLPSFFLPFYSTYLPNFSSLQLT